MVIVVVYVHIIEEEIMSSFVALYFIMLEQENIAQ